ncbi:MAG: MBL fold metallo-hydrolase RNA specificity domain-containing protein [Oscillibacter sp.]
MGYQGEGTLGRRLLDGAATVKLFGEEISVQAKIYNFKGLSSHADRDHLLAWAGNFTPKPAEFFVVHGENAVTEAYANSLRTLGLSAHAPLFEEVYDLAEHRLLAPGVVLPPKPKALPTGDSPAYRRLEEASRRLQQLVSKRRGGANKDLARLTDQLLSLLDKWEK